MKQPKRIYNAHHEPKHYSRYNRAQNLKYILPPPSHANDRDLDQFPKVLNTDQRHTVLLPLTDISYNLRDMRSEENIYSTVLNSH